MKDFRPVFVSLKPRDSARYSKSRVFEKGDLIGFDYGVLYKGMNTDSAVTLAVGGIRRQLKPTTAGRHGRVLDGGNQSD